ncbi:MAG: radical SAM family heme chaperone HemW [Lachnospiraceae bacterium]|nr:radical SAM family heme chaperone HemW [Lachnospiraceae bacterium]
MLELYIHIPFCVRKCNYCDFLSFPETDDMIDAYCRALIEEIKQTGERVRGESVRSVFVGGGTPSILMPEQITEIFLQIRKSFLLEADAEITIESNPGTLDEEKLQCYQEIGINRLSIGLQSTDDNCLKRLGRIHNFREFEKNYDQARKVGFTNINIDLMSGLPGQSLSQYEETLRRVTDLNPEHISSYSLIIEEGTPFYESEEIVRQLPDEETERKMYEQTRDILNAKGYDRYEISNYARKGKECIHNLGYWEQVPYLGVGLGASSYYNKARFSNERNLKKYLNIPFLPFEEREEYATVSLREQMEDRMIFGLRKRKGISISQFKKEYGISVREIYGEVIDRYSSMGFLQVEDDVLKLTDAGIDVSNRIFEDFLLG